ncbi:MAG: flagellar hook-basal body protein [Phycisphaerales bacterium]|nr:flagellar hook-basal body protein [Phycisphaerales bacterium]
MIYGYYQSAAGMLTNEYRQSVIANNLANAETVGFKRDMATFAERLRADRAGIRNGATDEALRGLTGGAWLGETRTDFSPGSFIRTDQPLDFAIDGDGFFQVEQGGKAVLTRDGRFVADERGQIRSATDGAPLMSRGGGPIFTNPRGGEISVDEDGRLSQDGAPLGQLAVVDVADRTKLRKAGASRFDAGEQQIVPVGSFVKSRVLESSGVEPVRELVTMIEAARAYQMNAQMVSLQDQSVGRLISAAGAV